MQCSVLYRTWRYVALIDRGIEMTEAEKAMLAEIAKQAWREWQYELGN